ncbi:unnamed protein product [Peronospora belbahrii]|uniref:Uncharacterized protein n=1 Tax=Peronospora belbahrii TaxID=622444 RepID=A0ABN8D3B2_9STRA|nr:unnamed protein product [Peronospora belbahrii]
MEDSQYVAMERQSPHSDSLSGLHTAWMDDEQLNSLVIMDVYSDALSPRASMLSTEFGDYDSHLLDAALDLPMDTELSPILESFAETAVAMNPIKRPRTRSSLWQEQEQSTFYALFKVKWPPIPEGKPLPPFSSLLLQRFDVISTKIRTKSVMEVRQFYTTVMQNIYEMLAVVDNDVDLTNPDQVRIAVWCWSKLMADKKHREQFQSFSSKPASAKVKLANVLLQSIIRSRRQMLKAKSEKSTLSSNALAPGLTSISAWVSRSNLSSFFSKKDVPCLEVSTAKIHHPMVRKKHFALHREVAEASSASAVSVYENAKKVLSLPALQHIRGESPRGATLKRTRSVFQDRCLSVKSRRPEIGAASLSSPPQMKKSSRLCTRNGAVFHTPQHSSRRKVCIKMRMVPRDKRTKIDLVRCGCRPKVELKLSSTKKISEITEHMSRKWAKVRPLLPKEAVLCFFQKSGTYKWSKEGSNVTCFDIWKLSGKQINGEKVVDVSYVWLVPEKMSIFTDNEYVQAQNSMCLPTPSGLCSKEMCSSAKQLPSSSEENEARQLLSTRDLQEISEEVAFDPSITAGTEEAFAFEVVNSDRCPDLCEKFSVATGRLRRRIKPVLVSKEEFNI